MTTIKVINGCVGAAVLSVLGGTAIHASGDQIAIAFVAFAVVGYVGISAAMRS
ncbi:hypothetical protein [Bradyrhizobium canariense]|uniref:hypothetical protein n=1 Tax=Bradyrhizobium canariense TaxID=255045 RepID=UPI0014315395|nr:hypothetical protein [Bradyrhizobium canariense]